jgi:hypothetical protein
MLTSERFYFHWLGIVDDLPYGPDESHAGWRAGYLHLAEFPLDAVGAWAFLLGWDLGFEHRSMWGRMEPNEPMSQQAATSYLSFLTPQQVWGLQVNQASQPNYSHFTLGVVDNQLVLGTAHRLGPDQFFTVEVLARGGVGLGRMAGHTYTSYQTGGTVGLYVQPAGWFRAGVETGYSGRWGHAEGSHVGRAFHAGAVVGFVY